MDEESDRSPSGSSSSGLEGIPPSSSPPPLSPHKGLSACLVTPSNSIALGGESAEVAPDEKRNSSRKRRSSCCKCTSISGGSFVASKSGTVRKYFESEQVEKICSDLKHLAVGIGV